MAAQIAARLLQNNWGGKGILMGGVPGVPPAEVVIGGGVVGTYATQTFLGMGAHVTVIDHSLAALQRLWDRFPCIVTLHFHETQYRALGSLCGCGRGRGAGPRRACTHPRDARDGPVP